MTDDFATDHWMRAPQGTAAGAFHELIEYAFDWLCRQPDREELMCELDGLPAMTSPEKFEALLQIIELRETDAFGV